ncbi:hypothetical protein P2H44_20290 [Albimonas sp. CAU 1670]|uniref:hypothetical protein n=1 Tax=Albimonas sp. CAU 1670 TaxID=3032599 RepID=UPI0023DA18BF|nr:hypothetical protein [Albimonas sp. CAU 1670]MDF2234906.1 hypothetical protein [Albimonas sp. CAU 1670]
MMLRSTTAAVVLSAAVAASGLGPAQAEEVPSISTGWEPAWSGGCCDAVAAPPRRWGPRLPSPVRDLRRREPVWLFPEPTPYGKPIYFAPAAELSVTAPGVSVSGAYFGDLPFGLPDRLPKAQLTLSGDLPDYDLPGDLSFDSIRTSLRALALPEGEARLDVAGHWATASYDADANLLSLTAPLLDLDRSWTAETGRDAERIFRRLWRKHRSTIETAYLKWSAAHRSDDPVAGNPWSTMYMMATGGVDSFFFTSSLADGAGGRPVMMMRGLSATGETGGELAYAEGAGGLPRSGPVRGGPSGFSGTTAGAVPLGADGRVHLVFSAPMAWAATGGAHRLNGAANVGLLAEVLPDWTLGLMAQGGIGAQTAAGAAWLAGSSVASRYTLEASDGLSLSFLNSVSSLTTLPFEYAGRTVDYDLSNLAMRNAVAAERPLAAPDGIRAVDMLGMELSQTRFTGDALYVEQSWEAAVTWRRIDPQLGEVAAARLSALATDAGDTGARLSLDLAF